MDDPKPALIVAELDLGFEFVKTASGAYASGRIGMGEAALDQVQIACRRAARLVATHGAESLLPRLRELETLLEEMQRLHPPV